MSHSASCGGIQFKEFSRWLKVKIQSSRLWWWGWWGALLNANWILPAAARTTVKRPLLPLDCLFSTRKGVYSQFSRAWSCGVTLTFFGPQPPLPCFAFFGLNWICLDPCTFNVRALNSCLHFIFNIFSPFLKPKFLFGENVCPGRCGCSRCCRRRRWWSCRRWWGCPCRPSPGAAGGRPAAASGCLSSWSRRCRLHTRPAQ